MSTVPSLAAAPAVQPSGFARSYPATGPVVLKTHLADRPGTHLITSGGIVSPLVRLDICGPKAVSTAFKPLVREGAYEASELSIMTYLQARERGVPLILLPAVVLGRFQHAMMACRTEIAALGPKGLEGRRVGVRSDSVTTVAWARAILQHQYDVDLDRITWVALEDPHVLDYRSPPNVERIDAGGRTLEQLMLDGVMDAAVLAAEVKPQPGIAALLPDAKAAAMQWYRKFGVVSINHLFVVNAALSQARPDVVREIYRMLVEANRAAPMTQVGVNVLPFGVAANRKNLEFAIKVAREQKLIARRFTVDELFDETTSQLD